MKRAINKLVIGGLLLSILLSTVSVIPLDKKIPPIPQNNTTYI